MIAISTNHTEKTYESVKKMLHKMAWNATKRYGGDWEEYMSAANEGFVIGYNTYREGTGAVFSTWVWWQVRAKIQEIVNPRKIDRMTVNAGEGIDLDIHQSKKDFNLSFLLDDLSQDAKQVATIIINSPIELLDICNDKDGPSCIRSGLQRQLKETGWTIARIMESFIELKEAVSP